MFAEQLKEKIENTYGSLDDECGGYVNNQWLSVKDIVDLIDDDDNKDSLKDKIEVKYGDLEDECGNYVRNGAWLSVKDIVDLIDECDDDEDED